MIFATHLSIKEVKIAALVWSMVTPITRSELKKIKQIGGGDFLQVRMLRSGLNTNADAADNA